MNRFPTVAIFITASIYIGFGIWLGIKPTALLSAFGIDESTVGMNTEIRAFYGGVEIAIAVAMLYLWSSKQASAALVAGGLPLFGSAIGRLVGQWLDGMTSLHIAMAMIEMLGAIFCWAGYCIASVAPEDSKNG